MRLSSKSIALVGLLKQNSQHSREMHNENSETKSAMSNWATVIRNYLSSAQKI